MTELKPCPFCGSYAVRIAKDKLPDGGYIYDVHCINCGCGSPFRCTEEEVIEAWNKRVGEVDWFQSLPTKDKEKLFKYISEKCQKCGEENDKRYKR